MNWSPDVELLNQTLELGLECSRELQEVFAGGEAPAVDSDGFESLLLLCQAAGTLYYLGEEAKAAGWVAGDTKAVIESALAAWPAEELHRAYLEFLLLARRLPAASLPRENAAQGVRTAFFEEVVACLRERDRAHLVLRGATLLTQSESRLHEETADRLAMFDEALRQNLHFLIPMNIRRQNRVLWARPDRLVDFWWWEQGFEFPQDALGSLFRAAEIVRRFPGARAFFERLCESGDQLDRLLHLPVEKFQGGNHPTLRERLQPRKHPQEQVALAAKGLAGSSEERRILHENAHFSVIAQPDQLTVLLKAPYDAERDAFPFLPTAYIELPGESRHLLPQEQQRGVFASFRFSNPLFESLEGTLWVQCTDVQVSLELGELAEVEHDER